MARLHALSDKHALLLAPKAQEFLKAYTSNNLKSSQNAFLDRTGNIVAVFYQKALSADAVLAVIEKAYEPILLKHLETYLTFSETKVIREDWNIYYDLEKKLSSVRR